MSDFKDRLSTILDQVLRANGIQPTRTELASIAQGVAKHVSDYMATVKSDVAKVEEEVKTEAEKVLSPPPPPPPPGGTTS